MIMKLLLSNSLPQDILSSEGNPQYPAEQLWQVISKPSLPAVVKCTLIETQKIKRTTQNVMHMRVYRHTHLIFGLHL
jgi:hypothetical protein